MGLLAHQQNIGKGMWVSFKHCPTIKSTWSSIDRVEINTSLVLSLNALYAQHCKNMFIFWVKFIPWVHLKPRLENGNVLVMIYKLHIAVKIILYICARAVVVLLSEITNWTCSVSPSHEVKFSKARDSSHWAESSQFILRLAEATPDRLLFASLIAFLDHDSIPSTHCLLNSNFIFKPHSSMQLWSVLNSQSGWTRV